MKEILNILLEENSINGVVFNGVFLELFSLKGFSTEITTEFEI